MSPSSYASGTDVSPEKSRMEIESCLARFGASEFGYMHSNGTATIAFCVGGRAVRIVLAPPNVEKLRRDGRGRTRPPAALENAIAAETRRRWRSLALVIKAKLTAVSDGISTVEREFFADVVMHDGRTLSEHMRPALEQSKGGGRLLLPASLGGP